MGLSSKQVINNRDGLLDWSSQADLLQSHDHRHLQSTFMAKKNPVQTTTKRQEHRSQTQSEPLNCPRCDSSNTKFCYYNNYNKSQPRHFCRACKRHWTKGGTLRNVPVGGGRKNKRSKKSSTAAASSSAAGAPTAVSSGDDRDHEKSVSEILYQAMISRPPAPLSLSLSSPQNPSIFTATSLGFPQTLQFSSASSPFESSLSSISNSFQTTPSVAGDYADDQGKNMITGEYHSSGVATAITQPPWQPLMPSYHWNFEDIDTLVSADHINLPWDESLDIKP